MAGRTSLLCSLALLGLAVTEPFQQTINGEAFQVQWFERMSTVNTIKTRLGRACLRFRQLYGAAEDSDMRVGIR